MRWPLVASAPPPTSAVAIPDGNSVIDAWSGIGKNKFLPELLSIVSKNCPTWRGRHLRRDLRVYLIDLTGRARGKVIGRGGSGQRLQSPGTITALRNGARRHANNSETERNTTEVLRLSCSPRCTTQKFTHLLGVRNAPHRAFLRAWKTEIISATLEVAGFSDRDDCHVDDDANASGSQREWAPVSMRNPRRRAGLPIGHGAMEG